MKKLNKKDILRAIFLAGYILLFWYLFQFFPIVLDWVANWLYKITGRKEAVIVAGAIVLMFFAAIYAFGKIQGEFFGPIKKKKKEKG
jgi:hypothetical protein